MNSPSQTREQKAEQKPDRLVGFDLIRLVSFWVISVYHFVYAVWHDRVPAFDATMSKSPFFWNFIYPILHALSFSGHTVLFLTAILIALARKTPRATLKLCGFLLIAWLFFVWAENDFHALVPYWDIHPLILLGLSLSLLFGRKDNWRIILLGAIGFVMTWIPFWTWSSLQSLPLAIREILVGDCVLEVSSWPVLPWLGFFFLGFALGEGLTKPLFRGWFSAFRKYEWIFWSAAFTASVFHLGAFYKLHALEDWECHAFQIVGVEFWSHFVWVLFAIRLSLIESVNRYFARSMSAVSRLQVSRNFFLVYAFQYVFGFIVAFTLGEWLRTTPAAFNIAALLMLPGAELFAAVAVRLGARRWLK